MATTLKELKDLVDMLYEVYGDCPMDQRIFLNEMPGDNHIGFYDKGVESVIEVCIDQNW